VGDIAGGSDCSDELYERRKREFDASAHPFIYTPGDNEWTDCRQKTSGKRDPIERLAKIREVFFADRYSLGAKRIEMRRRTAASKARKAAAVPRIPRTASGRAPACASSPSTSPGARTTPLRPANDAEARCRNEANALWLDKRCVRASVGDRAAGVSPGQPVALAAPRL
jgi:hypothetical protein